MRNHCLLLASSHERVTLYSGDTVKPFIDLSHRCSTNSTNLKGHHGYSLVANLAMRCYFRAINTDGFAAFHNDLYANVLSDFDLIFEGSNVS